MSTFFLGLFHSCLLCNDCFSKDCKRINHRKSYNVMEANIIKLVSCIPIIFGQIMGIVIFRAGLGAFKEASDFSEKVDGVTNMIRGIFTFLGLGIVFLLIDILVTLALLIKNCLEECC